MDNAVIPNELPPSRMVYVLTTSEGRDKLFKLMQYVLLLTTWALQQDKVFPFPVSRDYWTKRFTSNLTTLRFGRCLFRLGRWLITIVYLQMSVKYLLRIMRARKKPTGAPRRIHVVLAFLLVVRSFASVLRSLIRDIVFLSETDLVRFRLSPPLVAILDRAQSMLWIVVSIADCILVEWRLSLAGWVPNLRSLRCGCDSATVFPVGNSRFQFAPTDLDHGCPYPLFPSFFSATEPGDMPVACLQCDQIAVDASMVETAIGSSAQASSGALFVPNQLRSAFEFLTLLRSHGNFYEMQLLRIKSFCELVLSLALAMNKNLKGATSFELSHGESPRVYFSTSLCGFLSALISLRRVWLAAGS